MESICYHEGLAAVDKCLATSLACSCMVYNLFMLQRKSMCWNKSGEALPAHTDGTSQSAVHHRRGPSNVATLGLVASEVA